jgi:hypothetical protein
LRHSLSYSHSDQALLRDPQLDECWDGLVVPGTLATYYFEGTGGFVLARRVPYLIDPRTPLLQTIVLRRPVPKASHLKLAEIHDPTVVPTWPAAEIPRSHWEDGRWPQVVERVLDFQIAYSTSATAKIDKYNALLLEAGRPRGDAQGPLDPLRLVPPYWSVSDITDPWWALSRQAIEIGLARHPGRVMPVIALESDPVPVLERFGELLADLPDGCDEVFCWASNWSEADATAADVDAWLAAVESGDQRGARVHNLYGGYLSVLLTARGLAGLNHGVGYSESRDSRRLAATGAPPARYYVPALREFLTVPNAQPVLDHLPAEWACGCRMCDQVRDQDGRPQVGRLNTEALKRHFLICRHAEFVRVDAGFDDELANLMEVGQWVVDNERPFLPASHGERLLAWADAVRPDDDASRGRGGPAQPHY